MKTRLWKRVLTIFASILSPPRLFLISSSINPHKIAIGLFLLEVTLLGLSFCIYEFLSGISFWSNSFSKKTRLFPFKVCDLHFSMYSSLNACTFPINVNLCQRNCDIHYSHPHIHKSWYIPIFCDRESRRSSKYFAPVHRILWFHRRESRHG